jgi:hypothetical protein
VCDTNFAWSYRRDSFPAESFDRDVWRWIGELRPSGWIYAASAWISDPAGRPLEAVVVLKRSLPVPQRGIFAEMAAPPRKTRSSDLPRSERAELRFGVNGYTRAPTGPSRIWTQLGRQGQTDADLLNRWGQQGWELLALDPIRSDAMFTSGLRLTLVRSAFPGN